MKWQLLVLYLLTNKFKHSMRIVFMGTPEFAVPSLKILIENDYQVVGVITATDKYGGRGNKQLIESAVKKYAQLQNIPILQPRNLKAPDFLEELAQWRADLQVVVAFRMLPVAVWDMPSIGTINLHGSLLPKYRGAAPINWAIINGETETGVTTFFLQHEIDTGDMLLQQKMYIGPDETAGDVHDRMMHIGAKAVLKSVQMIEIGSYQLQPQQNTMATKAPKIYHETCGINFDQPVPIVYNFIRGLSPYPAAWTRIDGQEVKIIRCSPAYHSHGLEPGTVVSDQKKYIKIAARDGFIQIHDLKMAGKRRMRVPDFLNGYTIEHLQTS